MADNGTADIVDVTEFKWERGPLNESAHTSSEDFVVRGVLQRAEAKNQNGRIYPKRILKREAERYRKERINERRAYGELDHPECFWGRTKMLTASGWTPISDVREGEMCMTLDTDTGNAEMQPVQRKVDEEYTGEMYRIKSRYIDTKVTPNHRFWILPRKDRKDQTGKFVTARALYENREKYTKWRIPNAAPDQNSADSVALERDAGISLDVSTKIEKAKHEPTVHCVTVDNGVFYAMDGGKPFWTGNSSEVELKHVSHVINSIEWRGNDLIGEVQVLPTPMGNILRTLMEQNLNVGISSRGMGSVKQMRDGSIMVGDDFELIAWDFVSNPSTHGAFMEQINESARPGGRSWTGVESIAQEIITEFTGSYV